MGGTWNRWGKYYAVREGDAHSWVEAYIDQPAHPAWVTFDPTPPSGAQPLEPRDGAYYLMRDFVEALSQRWNTYVVGYDLRKQVRIFDEVTKRYERFRSRTGVDRGPLGRLTRGPVVAGALLALVAAAYLAWKRPGSDAPPAPRKTLHPKGKKASGHPDAWRRRPALYRGLEVALHGQGLARGPSTPPLRHAEDLCSRQHPLAGEVLSLTTVYLEARFGGAAVTDSVRRDFERRVRDIRAFRPEPTPRAAGPG